MPFNTSLPLPVLDLSQAGEARRTAQKWGVDRGWDETLTGRLALIVSELARNLALHTSGGTIFLRSLARGQASGVEILSIDSGPGVANFNQCLRDGFSTSGTSGTGLGAVKRVSDVFAAHSQVGLGTVILSELWAKTSDALRTWQTGALSRPLASETVCGDTWADQHLRPGLMRLMIADGLGHGEFAAGASRKAIDVFKANPNVKLPDLITAIHEALLGTRGAAVAIAELDSGQALVSYVGIGNIAAMLVGRESTVNLVSLNGTAGAQFRDCRLFTYPWPENGTLIMNSDGLKTRLNISQYVGLLERHPSLLAGALHRDYTRGTDDSTVVVVRPAT